MKKVISLLLALVMAVSLAACGKGAEGGDGGAAEAVRTDLKLQLNAEPASLDFQQDSSVITQVLCGNMYSSLVTVDKDGNIEGELADTWEWNADYTEITFHLRDGVKFSDGSDITAEDVVYSYKRGIDGKLNNWFSFITDIKAVSPNEVWMQLNAPNTVWLNSLCLTFFGVMSKAYMESGIDLATQAGVTSGAYYMEAWNTGSNLVLKANPHYWRGECAIKDVDVVVIADANTALIGLETGDVDFVTGSGSLSVSDIETIKGNENLKLVENLKATYMFLSMNFGFAPFADVNVRRAINLGIDRDACNAVTGGTHDTIGSIPARPGITGYLAGYDAPAYDLEQAKAYLAQSAYPDGFEFTINSPVPAMTSIATAIQSQLALLNIKVNIKETDVSTLLADMGNGNYEAAIMSWGNANGDVTNLQNMYLPGSAQEFNKDPIAEYGLLLKESVTAEGAARDEILKQAYDMMADMVPYAGIYFSSAFYGTAADLQIDLPVATKGYVLRSMHWN